MTIIVEILKKRNALFAAAVIVGLLVGPGMDKLAGLNIPVLMVVMTVAALELQFRHFRSLSAIVRAALSGVLLNMFAAGAIVLGLGCLFFPAGALRDGIILAAACPPGLGIVPFTIVMGGSVAYSVNAFAGGYLFAVLLTPLLTGILIGQDTVTVFDVTGTMGRLILIPLVVALIIRKVGLRERLKGYYGPAVNTGFAVILAILCGVNRGVFLQDPVQIGKLFLIFLLSVGGLGLLIRVVLIRFCVSRARAVSVLLSGTVKNSLFASALGLSLIGPEAALPGTILTFVIFGYLMLVEKLAGGFPGGNQPDGRIR